MTDSIVEKEIDNCIGSADDEASSVEKMVNKSENTSLIEENIASSKTAENQQNEDEWLDIMGSNNFKKKILKPGLGADTRPHRGDQVTISITFYVSEIPYEEHETLTFIVGDLDVIPALDLVICLMEDEEKSKVIIPSKLAYGTVGNLPHVPPDTDIECVIEVKEIEPIDMDNLSLFESLQYGDKKRLRGNYFYERAQYIEAIHCYERAAEFLDSVRNSSGMPSEESQKLVDMRIKVHNNMAAAHLKLSAHSAALKSVEAVLKVQPKNVKALFRKAKILAAQGHTDEAIRFLQEATQIESNTKVIQTELSRLLKKREREEASQKAMYRRMFQSDSSSPPKKKDSYTKFLKWSAVTGGVLAVAVGVAAAHWQLRT